MVGSYLKLIKFTIYLSILLSVLLSVFDQWNEYDPASWLFYSKILLCVLITTIIYLPLNILIQYKKEQIEMLSNEQAKFLDNFPIHYNSLYSKSDSR